MAIDFAHYEGREQAFVKHTFLDQYLPALIGRIASSYREFVYVDGFSGPWQSQAGHTFTDTSFGIALNHMTKLKFFWSGKGKQVRMRAFLVEKNPDSYRQLCDAAKEFPHIDIVTLRGQMEDHSAGIADAIPDRAFSFTLIDPKGFPEISKMQRLLSRPNSEALINFMFDHANRFAGTDLIPALVDFFGPAEIITIKKKLLTLSGVEREIYIEQKVADNLCAMGDYRYAPVISVDNTTQDRTLYKLIFLSRHPKGLDVFRACQHKALEAQAKSRSQVKAKRRTEATGMFDMFASGEDAIPHDRSSKMLENGKHQAKEDLVALLQSAGSTGKSWLQLWPQVLTRNVITRSALGRIVNDLRKSGHVIAPNWPSNTKQIPDDAQMLIWAEDGV